MTFGGGKPAGGSRLRRSSSLTVSEVVSASRELLAPGSFDSSLLAYRFGQKLPRSLGGGDVGAGSHPPRKSKMPRQRSVVEAGVGPLHAKDAEREPVDISCSALVAANAAGLVGYLTASKHEVPSASSCNERLVHHGLGL
ncbi:hypothetical protein KPH14_012175 [Odynerus spinipes]|uniref:Uncharacterized protein n=1 Tax=Odynerus spinipes TaxID=1348599 RepID=A0AAD9VN42_9HYME|nr:hypothetical protein KPH14_012175 [Odynerus spinipes]